VSEKNAELKIKKDKLAQVEAKILEL